MADSSAALTTLETILIGQDAGPLVYYCALCCNFLFGRRCFLHHLQHCHIESRRIFEEFQVHVDVCTNRISSDRYLWISCFKCNRQFSLANDHKSKLKNWKGLLGWSRLVMKFKSLLRQTKVVNSVAKTGIWCLDLKHQLALLSVETRGTKPAEATE
jgi:hypothetical protein